MAVWCAQGLGDGPQLLHAERMQRQGCLGECAGDYTQYCCWGGHTAKTLHRKRPVKVEPKVFFANERTFLSWLHMSVMTGSIGAAMLGLVHAPDDRHAAPRGSNTMVVRHVGDHAEAIGKLMVLVGILMGIYALITFCAHCKAIRYQCFMQRNDCIDSADAMCAYLCFPHAQTGARERYDCGLVGRSRIISAPRFFASY